MNTKSKFYRILTTFLTLIKDYKNIKFKNKRNCTITLMISTNLF